MRRAPITALAVIVRRTGRLFGPGLSDALIDLPRSREPLATELSAQQITIRFESAHDADMPRR